MAQRTKNKIGGQFAPYLVEMLNHRTFRALSLSARRILDRIDIELARHAGNGNSKGLPITYADFVRHGINRKTIAPAIRECVALGFLKVRRGVAGIADHREPNRYTLTFRPVDELKGLADGCSHEWRKINSDYVKAFAKHARANHESRRYKPRYKGIVMSEPKTFPRPQKGTNVGTILGPGKRSFSDPKRELHFGPQNGSYYLYSGGVVAVRDSDGATCSLSGAGGRVQSPQDYPPPCSPVRGTST